jgi:hypothetical protein
LVLIDESLHMGKRRSRGLLKQKVSCGPKSTGTTDSVIRHPRAETHEALALRFCIHDILGDEGSGMRNR